MKPDDPQQHSFSTPQSMLKWAQSVKKTLVGGQALAAPVGTLDSSGMYNTFIQDNGNGVMLRIGANGDTSNTLTWSSSGTITINHGLQRQPMGFHVTDSNGQANVWRTATPTNNTIQLATSDEAVANTIYIF